MMPYKKWHTLQKNAQSKVKEILKFIIYMIQTHGHEILKSSFFPLQRDIPITFLCLIVGVGSISRVCVGSTSEKQ